MTEIMGKIDEENWKIVERQTEDIAKKVGVMKMAINGLTGKVERLEQGLLSMTNRQESMEKKLRSILEQSERIEQNMIVGSTRYDTINEKHEMIMQIMAEEYGEWNPLAKENLTVEANYMFDELPPSNSLEFQHRGCQLFDEIPQSNSMGFHHESYKFGIGEIYSKAARITLMEYGGTTHIKYGVVAAEQEATDAINHEVILDVEHEVVVITKNSPEDKAAMVFDELPQSNLMDLIESEVIANSSSKENVAMMFDEMSKDFVALLQVDNPEMSVEHPIGKQLKFEGGAVVNSIHSSDKFILKFEHFPLAGSEEIDQKLIVLVSGKDNALAEERLEGVDQKHVLNQWINSATRSLVHFVWDPGILDCR